MKTDKVISFLREISHLTEVDAGSNKSGNQKFVDLTGQMNWHIIDDETVAIESHTRIVFNLSIKEDRLELLSALAYQKYKSDQYDLIVANNEKFVLEHFKGADVSGYFFDM